MSLALSFLKQCGLPLVMVGLVALGAWMIHHEAWQGGRDEANAEWQKRWDEHALADAQATRQAEAVARAEEQRRQQSINKVIQDGQQQIDQARADADSAAARAGSMRDEADRIAQRLADSESARSACTAAASKAAAHYTRMLADVLKLADKAAGSMAANADQSRSRGLICEHAYDGVKGSQ